MKNRQQLKSGPSVGLEITQAVVRAVELKVQAREILIEHMAHGAAPAGSVQDGRVNDPVALGGALRRLWEEGGFSTRRCGLVVPVGTLTPQMLTVPQAPLAEQRLIVGGELSRFAAVEGSTPYGWMPMAAGGGAGGNMLAFLAEAEVIAGYRQALAAAGLEFDGCEPDSIAALRTVELGLRRPGAAAAVYVSPTCSEMAFLEAGRARYYRRLDLGLTAAGERPAAESAAGTAEEDPALSRFFASATSAQRVEADPLADLALEIKRSLQYYGRAYGSAPQPQQILLLGDSPALERLAQVIQDDLHLETEYLHPLHLYPHAPAIAEAEFVKSGALYSAALGAALRPLVDPQVARALDLRARDEAQVLARQAPRYLMAALTGSTAMVLLALLASVSLGAQLSQARGELSGVEAQLRALDAQRATSVVQIRQARAAAERLRKEAMPVPQLLIRLAGMAPESMALTNVELKEDGSLALEGEAATTRQVNRLLQQLLDDPRFRPPDLDTLDSSGQGGVTHFRVRTGLVGYGKAEVKK